MKESIEWEKAQAFNLAQLFTWVLEVELKTSHLWGKHFADLAISPKLYKGIENIWSALNKVSSQL